MPIIEMIEVKKVYRTTVALAIDRLAIDEGQAILLQGGNGSGKSTLLRILAGFSSPTSGRVIRARRLAAMRVGYAPQSGGVYDDMTFRQNLALYRQFYGLQPRPAGSVADFVCEAGLEEFLEVPVAELSGGLRHAVAIASVLDVEPQGLILDEPASDLDAQRKNALWLALKGLSASLAFLVMSSHGDEAPSVLNRKIRLEKGRMLS